MALVCDFNKDQSRLRQSERLWVSSGKKAWAPSADSLALVLREFPSVLPGETVVVLRDSGANWPEPEADPQKPDWRLALQTFHTFSWWLLSWFRRILRTVIRLSFRLPLVYRRFSCLLPDLVFHLFFSLEHGRGPSRDAAISSRVVDGWGFHSVCPVLLKNLRLPLLQTPDAEVRGAETRRGRFSFP